MDEDLAQRADSGGSGESDTVGKFARDRQGQLVAPTVKVACAMPCGSEALATARWSPRL